MDYDSLEILMELCDMYPNFTDATGRPQLETSSLSGDHRQPYAFGDNRQLR